MCVKRETMNAVSFAELNDHPESYCNGDCIWSYAHVERCVPRVAAEKLFVQNAADALQAIMSTSSKGMELLRRNARTSGDKTLYAKPDQALDIMQGMLPQLSEEIGAVEAILQKGMVSVSCGGNRARSCGDCVLNHYDPKNHDFPFAHCNGDCIWKDEMCVLRHDPLDRDANGLYNDAAALNKKNGNLRVSLSKLLCSKAVELRISHGLTQRNVRLKGMKFDEFKMSKI